MSCDIIAYVDHIRQQIKANKRPFGGVSIILLGDNKQLIPVADKPLYTELGKVQQKLNNNFSKDVNIVYETKT